MSVCNIIRCGATHIRDSDNRAPVETFAAEFANAILTISGGAKKDMTSGTIWASEKACVTLASRELYCAKTAGMTENARMSMRCIGLQRTRN